jgi:hypothetical protein
MKFGTQTLLAMLIVYIVNLFFVRYLWNNSLVKHVTILRPTTTILETFLLSLALTILTAPALLPDLIKTAKNSL